MPAGIEKQTPVENTITIFDTCTEESNEIYACRFKKWNKKAKDEIKKAVIWFDKSESRGFNEQGIFFYTNASLNAWKDYCRLSNKTPDCLIVYKLTRDCLPNAIQNTSGVEYKTEFVQMSDTEHVICLKTLDNISRRIAKQTEDCNAEIIISRTWQFQADR